MPTPPFTILLWAVIKSWGGGGGAGISSGYYECGPQLLSYKNKRKIKSKQIPSRVILRLLVAFTRQLEILAMTLELLGNVKPSYLFYLGLRDIPIG